MTQLNISRNYPPLSWLNDDLFKTEQQNVSANTSLQKGRPPAPEELVDPVILNNGSIWPQTAPVLTHPDTLRKSEVDHSLSPVTEAASEEESSFYIRLSAMLMDIWRNLMASQRRETEISGQRDILAFKTSENSANAMYQSALAARQGAIGGAIAAIGFTVAGTMKKIGSNTKFGGQNAKLQDENKQHRSAINDNKKLIQNNNKQIRQLDQESRQDMRASKRIDKNNNTLAKENNELTAQRAEADNTIAAAQASGYDDTKLQQHKNNINENISDNNQKLKANEKIQNKIDAREDKRDIQRNKLQDENDELANANSDRELSIDDNNIKITRTQTLLENERAKGEMMTQASHPASTMVESPGQREAAELNRESKLNETGADNTKQSARNMQESVHQSKELKEAMQRALQEQQRSQNAALDVIIGNIRV